MISFNVWFVLVSILAVVVVYVVLKIIARFFSFIPRWVYVLLMLGAFCVVVFRFFGATVMATFGL